MRNFATNNINAIFMKRLYLAILMACACAAINAQTYKRVTNLPHVYIETFEGKPVNNKTTYIYANMRYVYENDSVASYDSLQIRGRGNSTWNLAKKPYKIKFSQKEKFLGKGYAKAKKWTLLANAGDKTLMRNAITYALGDWLGLKNTPARKFVDLTLNGNYLGNYQISDQVEVRPHRVNITEQDYPLTSESDITGGYLLEVDGFVDGNCFYTSRYSVPVRIHYPKDDEIAAEQNEYIRQYINNFEKVLQSPTFADADKGYRRWVDSTSLANWFVATEVSGNIDGYYSTYFYKEQQDSALYWGPLWDYDIAYANDNRKGDTSNRLMTDVGYGATKNWVNRMWEDPWFAKLVNRRYESALADGMEEFLYSEIDSIASLIAESQTLNYNKWGINTRMLRERVLYSSYDRYVDDLKSYIKAHTNYLRDAFAGKKPAEPTPPFAPKEKYYSFRHSTNGKVIDAKGHEANMGDAICLWTASADFHSQQWEIIPVGDYFMIINRQGNTSLCDPTIGNATATTNLGATLSLAQTDADDDSQLWQLMPQGSKGFYNIINKRTNHTANLSGGNSGDGTSILSYATDSRNATSQNRLWSIIEGDDIETEPEPEPDAIASVKLTEYALGFNPETKVIHFGSETPELLTFNVRIYSANGTCLRTFRASDQCSLADLPSGTYIIVWKESGRSNSIKIQL